MILSGDSPPTPLTTPPSWRGGGAVVVGGAIAATRSPRAPGFTTAPAATAAPAVIAVTAAPAARPASEAGTADSSSLKPVGRGFGLLKSLARTVLSPVGRGCR